MSRSAYTVLKVPEDATESAIERAYQLRLIETQTSRTLSDSARQDELMAIEEANRTLSRSTSRALYDRKLAAEHHSADSSARGRFGGAVIAAAAFVAIAAGGYVWMQQREVASQLAEQDRMAAEQNAATVKAERIKFEEQRQRDATDRLAAEEARLAEARELREREMKAEKFVALPQAAPAKTPQQIQRENLQRQFGEYAEQSEAEQQRRQAQQVADRQKRFVDQLTREENHATEERSRAMARDQARRRAEEQNAAYEERLRAIERENLRRR